MKNLSLIITLTLSFNLFAGSFADNDPIVSCELSHLDKDGVETIQTIQERRIAPANMYAALYETEIKTDNALITLRVSDKNLLYVRIEPSSFVSGKVVSRGRDTIEASAYTASNFGKVYDSETYDQSRIRVQCSLTKEITRTFIPKN